MSHRYKLLVLALAVVGLYASPARAQSYASPGVFFDPEAFVSYDANGYEVYYLPYFNYFTFDPSSDLYVYKYDFGWLYYFGGTTSADSDAYFYDFTADDYFYTSDTLYPYIYSFNLGTYLYYYESSSPREFFDFADNQYLYD